MSDVLNTLVTMTRAFGEPDMDYVIVGEGNTSARVDEETFYVKASGQRMNGIDADGFVQVRFEPVLALLDNPPETRTDLKAKMKAACVDQSVTLAPSIETSFHAMLLHETGAQVVGHTHPTAVNQLACSTHAETFAARRLFPDHAVLSGPEAVFVPYADPGLPLAIVMRDKVRAYTDKHGRAPHELILANHGMIALGATTSEVANITAMCVKAARIMVGALSVGEPVFMDPADVAHIYNRPDEIYRRQRFADEG